MAARPARAAGWPGREALGRKALDLDAERSKRNLWEGQPWESKPCSSLLGKKEDPEVKFWAGKEREFCVTYDQVPCCSIVYHPLVLDSGQVSAALLCDVNPLLLCVHVLTASWMEQISPALIKMWVP